MIDTNRTKNSRRRSLEVRLSQALIAADIEKAKTNDFQAKLQALRRNPTSLKMLKILQTGFVQGVIFASTIWAVFGQDILKVISYYYFSFDFSFDFSFGFTNYLFIFIINYRAGLILNGIHYF